MSDKFNDSKIKELERKLLYKKIVEQMKDKAPLENTIGFTLCSSSVILEHHLSNYANHIKKPLALICAESDSKHFPIAKKKLDALRSNYFNSVIFDKKDSWLFADIQNDKERKNNLDFAWHDWCGPLDDNKIETIRSSAQCIKEGGLLSVTVSTTRDKDMLSKKRWMKKFNIDSMNITASEKKAYLVPSLLDYKLGKDDRPHKKGLTLLNALMYSVSYGETRAGQGRFMLFYIFQVNTRDKKVHRNFILKKAVAEHMEYKVCHNKRTFTETFEEGLSEENIQAVYVK